MVEERKTWQGVISLIAVLALSLDISFSSWWTTLSIGVSQWTLCNIVSGLTQWAFPSVVTVFGSIFLSPARHIKMKVLWQRFIPAALFSCAVWWLSTSVVTMHNNHPQDLDFLTFRECMVESLEAPAFIGFCHMLVSFFILYPLLYRIVSDEKILVYAIILFFVMGLLEASFNFIPYLSIVSMFTDQLNWGFFRAWTFYLLFGAWITNHDLSWKSALLVYVLGILATAGIIALTSITTNFSPGYANEYIGYTSPLTGIQTVALTVFIRRLFARKHSPKFIAITRNTWHCVPAVFVVSIFTDRMIGIITDSSLISVVLSGFCNFIIAIGIVLLLGFLPGFKFLVGNYRYMGGLDR